MVKCTLLAAVVLVFTVTFAQAQTPDLPLSPSGDQPAASSALIPDLDTAPPAHIPTETMIVQDMALGDCGCQGSTLSASCNACQHMTWKERCAYYHSVRNAFDRGPCCAASFGGFGPLWDSYCCDRQNCCATACAPARCRTVRWPRHRRACSTCDACDSAASCDCSGSATGLPGGVPMDIGQPPQPTESGTVPPTPELDAPQDTPKDLSSEVGSVKSARRSWLNRTISWGD